MDVVDKELQYCRCCCCLWWRCALTQSALKGQGWHRNPKKYIHNEIKRRRWRCVRYRSGRVVVLCSKSLLILKLHFIEALRHFLLFFCHIGLPHSCPPFFFFFFFAVQISLPASVHFGSVFWAMLQLQPSSRKSVFSPFSVWNTRYLHEIFTRFAKKNQAA